MITESNIGNGNDYREEMRIVALRHDMTAGQRKAIALQSLEQAMTTLELLDDDIADAETVNRIERVQRRLHTRRSGLQMRLGMVQLAGMFGRVR